MRKYALLLLAALLFCASVRAGIIDQNGNGLDDVWETVFHASGLNPLADDDGDGFSNFQESVAGTDPRDPNSHPPTVAVSVGSGTVTLTWGSVAGKQYRVQTSPSLGAGAAWTFLGTPVTGTGGNVSAMVGTDGTARYYRVQFADLDSDGDGINDWAEIVLGYNPYSTDTFNTGLGDRQGILGALAATDTISVAADRPLATTAYGDAGSLRFTRGGNLDAVTVAYTVGGTATPGTDYVPLSGTVTFPLGVNTVTVKVTPAAGSSYTANRTVVATLASGAGYGFNPDGTGLTATVTLCPLPAATGQIVAESWDNVLAWGLSYVPFDTALPNRRTVLTSLEAGVNTGYYNYGSRLRGYITAPTTGNYTFWVAADDVLEFRLSTDDQMANLALRAYTNSWTNSREWNKNTATQKSAVLVLVAGKRYAFECKFLQGSGGDNLAVGWLKPGQTGIVPSEVVPGSVLSAYNAPFNPPGVTTLYFATLNRTANAPAGAQGFASVRLTADESAGILSISTSGLSGTPTSLALRGPADPGATGPVLAEFASATPQADGTYIWKITDPTAVTALKNGRVYASVATAANPAGELIGWLLRSVGNGSFTPPAAPPAAPTVAATAGDAARLLTQATFGATTDTIAAVQRDGYAAWVDAQLAAPPTFTLPYLNNFTASGISVSTDTFQEAWWSNAITAPDQLRQRVAFALSEIFVVSDVDGDVGSSPGGMASYYDTLLADAFGNYRKLLEDVTLHPVMGVYLDMLHNDKANPTLGTEPNENYGREVMQLFAVGLKKLNPDGTLLLDGSSQPIPTYGQDEVKALSRVFTGWHFAQQGSPGWDYIAPNYRQPMQPVPGHHDAAAKKLLDNVVLPAGQTDVQDLHDALDLLANHASTGPFICKQLIQRLVTSNPSPGYVYRVAQVFANNGQGVRGDLRAVVRAILLDYEARAASMVSNTQYGKQREPLVRLAAVYRAFNGKSYGGRYQIGEYESSNNYGQAALGAPSVFNFFPPAFTLTGEIAAAGLVCPEFSITTATTVVSSSNNLRNRVWQTLSSSYPYQISLNLQTYQALASDPAALVDSLNPLLLNGQMSTGLRTQTINAVTGVSATNPLLRAQTAVQLLCTAPEFCIQK